MFNYIKHFDVWFKIKPQLDNLSSYPKFQEGDVWWCHKNSPFYRPVVIKGIRVSALMSQMRLFDVKRLLYKQGKISPNELAFLKNDFIKLLIKK